MKQSTHALICALSFLLLLQVSPVRAAGMDPVDCSQAQPAFRLHLPGEPESGTWQLLLDGDDVTRLARVENGTLFLSAPEPLRLGPHTLEFRTRTPTGQWQSTARWQHEVCVSDTHTSVNVNMDGLAAADLVANSPLGQSPDRYVTQGGLALQFAHAHGATRLDLDANLVHDSRNGIVPSGRELDLGQYLMKFAVSEHARFAVGYLGVEADNLALSGFYRPGLSGQFDIPSLKSRLQVFHQQIEDRTGWHNPTRREDHVSGVVWDFWPVRDRSVQVTTTYADARQHDVFLLDGQGDRRTRNASLKTSSRLLNSRLLLSAERAASRTRERVNSATRRDHANAYLLGANTTLVNARRWHWHMEGAFRSIEPDFVSTANPFVVDDIVAHELQSRVSMGKWSLMGRHSLEKNNTTDRLASTDRSRFNGATLSYSGQTNLSVLGKTNLSLVWEQQNQRLAETDNTADRFSLTGDHRLKGFGWHWRLGTTWSEQGLNTEVTTRDYGAGISLDLPGFTTSITATRQRSSYDTGGARRFYHYAFRLQPDSSHRTRFFLNLDYNENRDSTSPLGLEQQRRAAGFGVTRTFFSDQAFGLRASLTGSWVQNDQPFAAPTEGLQVLLKLELNGRSNFGAAQ